MMMSYANYSKFDDEEVELGNDWGFYEDIEVATTYRPFVIEPVIEEEEEVTEKRAIQIINIEKLLEKVQTMRRRRDEEDAEVDRVSKHTNGLTRGVIMSVILISILILK
jgi:hypothetical protein